MENRVGRRQVNKWLAAASMGVGIATLFPGVLAADDHEVTWMIYYDRALPEKVDVCSYRVLGFLWKTNCKVNLQLRNFPPNSMVTITAKHGGMERSEQLFNEFNDKGVLTRTVANSGNLDDTLHANRDALPPFDQRGKWTYTVSPHMGGIGPEGNPEIIIEN